jgi:hypothetical protein
MSTAATVMPISVQRMVCTGCGAEANASCNCGMDYKPKSVRAREAVEANPEKSDRAIAKEVGVSQPTVSKARKELEATDKQLSVQERTGLDGKTRKLPERNAETASTKQYNRKSVQAEKLAPVMTMIQHSTDIARLIIPYLEHGSFTSEQFETLLAAIQNNIQEWTAIRSDLEQGGDS